MQLYFIIKLYIYKLINNSITHSQVMLENSLVSISSSHVEEFDLVFEFTNLSFLEFSKKQLLQTGSYLSEDPIKQISVSSVVLLVKLAFP